MKMRSYNFCHTNTKNPGNNLGIFCLITGRPKLNGYNYPPTRLAAPFSDHWREHKQKKTGRGVGALPVLIVRNDNG